VDCLSLLVTALIAAQALLSCWNSITLTCAGDSIEASFVEEKAEPEEKVLAEIWHWILQ
jgi:hypothetical protein